MQAEVSDYVQRQHPRVLFVGYGETDEWAHAGRYDMVLKSAHQFDQLVADVIGAEAIRIAVLGPDTPAPGDRIHVSAVTQSQVAATIATLLGENYNGVVSAAALPLPLR